MWESVNWFHRSDKLGNMKYKTQPFADISRIFQVFFRRRRNFIIVSVTAEELYQYFANVILSDLFQLHLDEWFGKQRQTLSKSLISKTMSINKFGVVDKNVKAAKMRPLMDHLNRIFTECIQQLETHFSLDEEIEPYYGRHNWNTLTRLTPFVSV